MTALGSAGARRVLGAAWSRSGGARRWTTATPNRLGLDARYPNYPSTKKARWGVMVGNLGHWVDIDRATARLLLAGLLGDAAVREFVEVVALIRRAREHCAGWALTSGAGEPALDDLDNVLTRLKEMGVPLPEPVNVLKLTRGQLPDEAQVVVMDVK